MNVRAIVGAWSVERDRVLGGLREQGLPATSRLSRADVARILERPGFVTRTGDSWRFDWGSAGRPLSPLDQRLVRDAILAGDSDLDDLIEAVDTYLEITS